jgi:iron complex outermembrane receptor protein
VTATSPARRSSRRWVTRPSTSSARSSACTSPGGETLDYIAGFYYQSNELDFNDSIRGGQQPAASPEPRFRDISTRRFANQTSDMWAAFAQVTWNINDSHAPGLGGRYSEEDKEATKTQIHYAEAGFGRDGTATPAVDPTGQTPNVLFGLNPLFGAFSIEPYDEIRGEREEKEFNPLVTLQVDVLDDSMLYATYVEGFKAGGFDIRSNGHPDPAVVNAQNLGQGLDIVGVFEFEDETAESIEIGGKFRFGGAAELNVAAFFTEYTDLQTSQFDGVLGFNVTQCR